MKARQQSERSDTTEFTAPAHHPVILLLDEVTSALDVGTEQAVEQNIRALTWTHSISALRLSTSRHADRMLVLDQGTMLERGTHAELLRQQGSYAQAMQRQLATGDIKASSCLAPLATHWSSLDRNPFAKKRVGRRDPTNNGVSGPE